MAVRRHSRIVRSAVRQTTWVQSVDNTDHLALAAATSLFDQFFVSGDPTTIVRTRGLLTVFSDQSVGSETPFGAVGMGIVSDEAAAAGAASIPAPYSNAAWDGWFVHQPFAAPMRFADATGFADYSQSYVIDSKAMRKLSPDDTVVVMVENASAADGLLFVLQFRMLFKSS